MQNDEAGLPVFELTELVDELSRPDEDGDSSMTESDGAGKACANGGDRSTSVPSGPMQHQLAGERIASAFWRCAQESGYTALCEALTFCGLRDELPRLMAAGATVLAPTDEAFSQICEESRHEPRLVRQLLLGHICSGVATLADMRTKNCVVALAGQTHNVVVAEAGEVHVGTSRLGATDVRYDGGILHEVSAVLLVLSLVRDSHSEQVWKKSMQPSPILSVVGGTGAPSEFEVHGCLLHAATGQLVPEGLRGHVKRVSKGLDEQRLTFS